MAKQFMFSFTAHKAEFYPGGVSVAFSLRGQNLAHERKLCTLAEAEAHVRVVSAAAPGPHRVIARLDNPSDRAPAGYAKATAEGRLHCDKRAEETAAGA